MNLFKILLFAAVALIPTLATKLTIIGPQSLADQFGGTYIIFNLSLNPTTLEDDIVFSLSHFGNIPYGAHLVGQVFLAEPIDACGRVEAFHEGENTYHENVVALVKRGGCRISTKIRNAQFAGAKVVILVDNNDNQAPDFFGHEQGGR